MREPLPDADKRPPGCFSTGDSYWWGGVIRFPDDTKWITRPATTRKVAPPGFQGPVGGPEGGGVPWVTQVGLRSRSGPSSLHWISSWGFFRRLLFTSRALNRKCLPVPKHSRWLVEYNELKGFILCPKTTRLDPKKVHPPTPPTPRWLSHDSSFCCEKLSD